MPEPHEFTAVVTLKRGTRIEKYETGFVEDHHHHGHGQRRGAEHEGHDHARNFSQIKELIQRSALSDRVKQKSIAVFRRIAVAEGQIHGLPPEQVHFHEVGAVDSIVDIVGACVALEILGQPRVLAGPVVEGVGFIENDYYRVRLNDDGDIAGIFDKKINKELLAAPARLAISYDNPVQWPAWNMDWDQEQAAPKEFVSGPAKMRIVLPPSREVCSIQLLTWAICSLRRETLVVQKLLPTAVPLTSRPSRVQRPLSLAR